MSRPREVQQGFLPYFERREWFAFVELLQITISVQLQCLLHFFAGCEKTRQSCSCMGGLFSYYGCGGGWRGLGEMRVAGQLRRRGVASREIKKRGGEQGSAYRRISGQHDGGEEIDPRV